MRGRSRGRAAFALRRLRRLALGPSKGRREGDRNRLGARAERLACRMLRRAGYKVLARNAETAAGEVDVIALSPDRRVLVMVEVKSRSAGAAAAPEVQAGPDTIRRLRRAAEAVRRANAWQEKGARVDVVGVDWPAEGSARPEIRHHVGVG